MSYRPGYCNIGPRQRRRRFAVGAVVLAVAAAYLAACLTRTLPRVLLPGVFVPLAIGFEYLFQAVDAICVRLAFRGRYDFRGDDGTAGEVSAVADRRADRMRAAKLSAAAVAVAGVLTLAVALVA